MKQLTEYKSRFRILKGVKIALVISALLGSATLSASTKRDTTFNVYGVAAKTDGNESSFAGVGIAIDSEDFKAHIENTSDFLKLGTVFKFNLSGAYYLKLGANIINQKIYAPDDTNTRVNQFSGALGLGYMLSNDLYIELGTTKTRLMGKVFGDYEIVDEDTNVAYGEVAKRFENSSFGTVDITANAGRVFYEFKPNESSYGTVLSYYPTNASKLSVGYQNESNNAVASFSAQYGFVFVDYSKNVDLKTYQVNAGIKIAYSDITDFSTYSAPKNIIPHLSEHDAFENLTFGINMNLQSTNGVQMTQVAKDRIANQKEKDEGSITPPTLVSKTNFTINLAVGTVTDNDGVRNVTVKLYTDSNLTALVAESNAGTFSSLTANIDYYAITYGETLNSFSNKWEEKVSTVLKVTTNTTDVATTITAPTFLSKTRTSINTAIGTFADADGVRNVTVSLYQHSDLTFLVGTNTNGDFTGLYPGATYYAATTGEAFNTSTSTWETKKSGALSITLPTTNSPTTTTAPTLSNKTVTSINTTVGTFSDADGVRNVTVKLYSDSGLNTLVGTNASGDFNGLIVGTTYYAVTTGEALNATTSTWESKTSNALSITISATDSSTTISAPTLSGGGVSTINTTIGTFTDADGVRNVTVELYSDSGLNTSVGTSASGDFTGLTSGTTYYAVTTGEAFNVGTATWDTKKSSALSVTTDSPTTITAPTLSSRTGTSINITVGTFADADGVQNVTVNLYNNSRLGTPLQTNASGNFTGLTEGTSYYVVITGQAKNAITSSWENKSSSGLSVSTRSDAATNITKPTFLTKTTSSINTTIGTFTDTDGVRNVTVELYSDSGLNTSVGTSTSGDFTSLISGTTYYAVTTGEALNGITTIWETKKSSALSITLSATDSSTTITAPTLSSAIGTRINITIGTFTDADGVRNVTVELYSDSGLNTSVGTSASGDFTGLTSGITYYAVTRGEAFNAGTAIWETKKSNALSVTIDSRTTITAPTLSSKTATSISTNVGTFSDADGVQSVAVELYSDYSLNTLVGTSASGDFTILSPSTLYYAVTKGEAKNATTSRWETKRSSAIRIQTSSN